MTYFKELKPPTFKLIIKINAEKTSSTPETWKCLLDVKQTSPQTQLNQTYIVYKGKQGNLVFLYFQNSCLLSQKTFKMLHSQQKQICCIRIEMTKVLQNECKKDDLIICVGYQDGIVEIYCLLQDQQQKIVQKLAVLISIQNNAVTNIVIKNQDIYISRLHSIGIYRSALQSIRKAIKKNSKKYEGIKCQEQTVDLGSMNKSTTLQVEVENSLFAYNLDEGLRQYSLADQKLKSILQDSVLCMKEANNKAIILGCADNTLKIVYYGQKKIIRYTGFKSYPSVVYLYNSNEQQKLWIADFYGQISLLSRSKELLKPQNQSNSYKFIMQDCQMKYQSLICNQGIKNCIVTKTLLIILDCLGNIMIYDIINETNIE